MRNYREDKEEAAATAAVVVVVAAAEEDRRRKGEIEDFGHRNYRRRVQAFFFLNRKFHLLLPRCFLLQNPMGSGQLCFYLSHAPFVARVTSTTVVFLFLQLKMDDKNFLGFCFKFP